MFNDVLSPSVEMDRLVIVSVRSVVGFGSGSVAFVVSIGFSLAHTNFFLRLGAVLNADSFVWEYLFQMRVLLYIVPVFVYESLYYFVYVVTELCDEN